MTDKILKYIVTAPGLDKHEVGEVIELTEIQAEHRKNKVRLKSEADKEGKSSKASDKALEKAEKSLADLTVKYDAQCKVGTDGTTKIAELEKVNKALEKENKKLSKQVLDYTTGAKTPKPAPAPPASPAPAPAPASTPETGAS